MLKLEIYINKEQYNYLTRSGKYIVLLTELSTFSDLEFLFKYSKTSLFGVSIIREPGDFQNVSEVQAKTPLYCT